MGDRAAAVNVDVDSLYLYYRIWGLDDAGAADAVWTRGVPRFADLFAELGISATFFVVASDLDRVPEAEATARALAAAGHELASHTWSHPYDLTRLPEATIADELDRAAARLGEVRGTPITGFRAPGYTMTDPTWSLLAARGYGYSSSLFPSPPYYLAKAAAMAWTRLRGRRSQSILDHPRVMWADRRPHWRRGVLELPVSVLPLVRFPFIGTSLLVMGRTGYRAIRPLLGRLDFVNLELHGVDLCDAEEDGIDPRLRDKQPDLRVPLSDKLALLREVFTDLRDGWGVDTLENLAPRWNA